MTEVRNARLLLRDTTAGLHAELDALLARSRFDDRASYTTFLIRQAGPLFATEDALERSGVGSLLPDWEARRRSAAMRADLAGLGVAAPEPERIGALASADAVFGTLYVLEGSRLGAKFLSRAARASEDPVVRTTLAYLTHGEGQSFWPSFLDALAARERDGLDRVALVEGATDAFRLFLVDAKRIEETERV